MNALSPATAISPLDGRYHRLTARLASYFSEFALMRQRCVVELEFLKALDETGLFPPLSPQERARMEALAEGFDHEAFGRIKALEEVTKHDVKALELFLRERLNLSTPGMIHFGLTSEDVNNIAYSTLLAAFIRQEQLPLLDRMIRSLVSKVREWRDVAFPARTHGQLASPSTLGKEMAVFVERLLRHRRALASTTFRGKCFGATGTGAAWKAAFPQFDWVGFSRAFVRRFGLEPAVATTQIEDHDSWAAYFCLVSRINGVVRDLDVDVWLYQALGYMAEEAKPGEVGSSTMPHKVNPIRFENSEGNLHVADALLATLAKELTHSRLQRDLSDSTMTRCVGTALAHSHLAWTQTLEGLGRLVALPDRCREALEASPQLLAEPFQTILRAAGLPQASDQLWTLTRGRQLCLEDLHAFASGLDLPAPTRELLLSLDPLTYTGFATHICDEVVAMAQEVVGPP